MPSSSRLSALKEYLTKYRTFEGERDVGYEGHHEWHDEDLKLQEAQAYFYKLVRARNKPEVRGILAVFLPSGSEDSRLSGLLNLLDNIYSEEALKEALLVSISIGSRPLVEMVLCLFVDAPHLERSGCCNSANFPPHMTPLMLACVLNNFSIVQCLLIRGHTVQIPHFVTCECELCKRQTVTTRSSCRLVDVMRAVSSEAFLWLATEDVFAASCAVVRDLQRLIREDELEHVETFRTLEANVQRFMARLSDSAWRAEEFNVLVANRNYCSRRNTEISSPRLQMAMDAHLRQFTCSTNTQTAMKSIFRADWYNFGNKPKRDAWRLLRASLLMPFLVILHSIVPSKGTTMAIPLARYIAHISTYSLFLMCACFRPTIAYYADWNVMNNPIAMGLEYFMYAYMAGLIVEKGILYRRVGSATFFSYWWRWFDAFLMFFFLMAFAFFLAAHSQREAFDPSTTDRMHWPATEASLLHEIFLSFACILGVSKCFYYMQMLKGIGGSVISVGKCVGKTYTYLIIMVTIIFSFSVGFNILIGPYVNRQSLRADGTPQQTTSQAYDTIGTSSINLFWSIFGYLGPSTYTTVVGNTGVNMEPVSHSLNSATLEVLGALYHGIIIITVLNLMTSLLVKKADEVLDNEEMEFKYTRAAIYAEFVSWEMAAPPPFNLLLVPCHYVHRVLLHSKIRSPSWSKKDHRRVEGAEDAEDEDKASKSLKEEHSNYMNMLTNLFYRFAAVKECKYKSVWRTEFDKEEKQPSNVAFMTTGTRSFPMDNTFDGWKLRTSKKIFVSDAFKETNDNYAGKGTARKAAVVDPKRTRKDPVTGDGFAPAPMVAVSTKAVKESERTTRKEVTKTTEIL